MFLQIETVKKVDLPDIEVFRGKAKVKMIFAGKKRQQVAGCEVLEGKMQVGNVLRIVRNSQPIYDGEMVSIRVVKDEVEEVEEGNECGILIERFKGLQVGDEIHSIAMEKPKVYD